MSQDTKDALIISLIGMIGAAALLLMPEIVELMRKLIGG